MDTAIFDVIIVGGGVAGSSVALSLLRSNPEASFLLVDDSEGTQFKIGESLPAEAKPKVRALSPAMVSKLSSDTAKGIHLPCSGNASIWASPGVEENFAITNPFGQGLHLDRAAFDESLRECIRIQQEGSRHLLLKRTFLGVRKDGSQWVVNLRVTKSNDTPHEEYRSLWLIDASGRKASVAQKLGAKTLKIDGLLAFYALFSSSELDSDNRTFIEATETGWWYSSQLAGHKRVVVFHTDDRDPASKVARKQPGFLDMLYGDTKHISAIVDEGDYHIDAEGNYPRCTAAGTSCLAPFGSQVDNWCAVGDAAMAFDPLSSQGIITSLRSGVAVGEMLAEELRQHHHLSTLTVGGLTSIANLYNATWEDYGKKRLYFYTQSMFNSDFWQRRRQAA
ncbi:hypothetical protein K438DRAFT_1965448 [Mycena galopus ATCC 62051]|nr:hypothetical protein K438DRAFT_1965448 [Mycena galopus ATCC 62051]